MYDFFQFADKILIFFLYIFFRKIYSSVCNSRKFHVNLSIDNSFAAFSAWVSRMESVKGTTGRSIDGKSVGFRFEVSGFRLSALPTPESET